MHFLMFRVPGYVHASQASGVQVCGALEGSKVHFAVEGLGQIVACQVYWSIQVAWVGDQAGIDFVLDGN